LNLNWSLNNEELEFVIGNIFKQHQRIQLDNSRGSIKEILPEIKTNDGRILKQTRFDFSRAKKQDEFNHLVSGFPLKDNYRHFELSRVCGNPKGNYIGFMDDCTPVRVNQEFLHRFSNNPDRIWFYLDNRIIKINLLKCFNGPADNRSYCAYDLQSAKSILTWFCTGKSIVGKYPIWANQYDLWLPKIKLELEEYWFALCFSFVLSENRCIVTMFEKDNPVKGAPEVFVDNPLCPANPESFWSSILNSKVTLEHTLAFRLVNKIKK